MNYCLNCGRQISKKQKTCSHECSLVIRKKRSEENKPKRYLVCQNPACGKELNHWVIYSGKAQYHPEMKYCDKYCAAAHKSVLQKGGTSGMKGKKMDKEKKKIIVTQPDNFVDIFSM